MTESDCAGLYPWPAVCEHNICVKYKSTRTTLTSYHYYDCSSSCRFQLWRFGLFLFL